VASGVDRNIVKVPAPGLKSVSEHRADVIAAIRPLPPRLMELDDADGAVLAADVTAGWPLPLFDHSAMDGYAVMARDVVLATRAAPVTLPVEAEVTAGDTRVRRLAAGTCVKIMTGALLPAGADAVVRVEWTDGGRHKAAISRPVYPGDAVREAGYDAQPGDVLLPAGTRLGPRQLGLLAAAGQHAVVARPRPRVTVLSAGNELAGADRCLLPGQIWESNGLMLAAAARHAGGVARRHPRTRDDRDEVLAAIGEAALGADLLVTSGGISMGGEHDIFKAALQGRDTVRFRRVAMQPGMPQGFGAVGEPATPIVLLPGNPVSAFVSFHLFAVPAMRALQGAESGEPPATSAVLTAALRSPAGKASFIPAVHDPATGEVAPAGQSSHQLTALAQANALIIVPARVTALSVGDPVEILALPV
jgi:molybdopterin molybdotransferase